MRGYIPIDIDEQYAVVMEELKDLKKVVRPCTIHILDKELKTLGKLLDEAYWNKIDRINEENDKPSGRVIG